MLFASPPSIADPMAAFPKVEPPLPLDAVDVVVFALLLVEVDAVVDVVLLLVDEVVLLVDELVVLLDEVVPPARPA